MRPLVVALKQNFGRHHALYYKILVNALLLLVFLDYTVKIYQYLSITTPKTPSSASTWNSTMKSTSKTKETPNITEDAGAPAFNVKAIFNAILSSFNFKQVEQPHRVNATSNTTTSKPSEEEDDGQPVEIPSDHELLSPLMLTPKTDCNDHNNSNHFALAKLGYCKRVLMSKNTLEFNNDIKKQFTNFSRVLLIVSMNKPEHFEALAFNYRLYHDIFFKIVFCVVDIAKLAQFENGTYAHLINISFVEWSPFPTDPSGEALYNCVPVILDVVPGIRKLVKRRVIEGFMAITDDLIINLWTFKADSHKTDWNWLLWPGVTTYDIEQKTKCESGETGNNTLDCQTSEGWGILGQYQKAAIASMKETEVTFPNFAPQLGNWTKGRMRVQNIWADMFYVSGSHLLQAGEIFRIWAKHRVYMELAVGTIIQGVTDKTKLLWVSKAGQQYGLGRIVPVHEVYNKEEYLFHPFKMAGVSSDTIDKQCLYCLIVSYFDWLRSG